MNTTHRAASPPVWRRVLACAATWLTFWPLTLAMAQCPPVFPQPGDFPEMEPNDSLPMAQPWPAFIPLLGEQTLLGDADFFRLEGLPADLAVEVSIQPDTFNPRLDAFGLMGGLWMPLGSADAGGWCESEHLVVGGWDPCLQLQPVEQIVVKVSASPFSPPMNGNYRAQMVPQPSTVPQGDCCQFPIPASGPLFTDTRSTATAYRDMGFGPSPDVWYQLVLDQATVLTAQTCGGSTNFDTMLRVVGADCQTVLASNDNSARCAPSLVESWLAVTLDAGTYYVVVEGSGNASGTFTLNLRLASCPGVVPGPGALHELEPNDEPWMAQPWNPEQQLFGEQTPLGDADCFRLLLPDPRTGFELTVQPDSFDPRLTVYAETPTGFVPVAEADNGGVCEAEMVLVAGWDPCTQLVPITGWVVAVSGSPSGGAMSGHYLGSALMVSSSVPAGDCCQYPLAVGAFPYNDSRDTSVSYRDMGLNASADVWYQVVLDQGGVLMAETCGAATNYDTMLWLVDDDCETVLDSNDDNPLCGVGSTKSRFSKALTAGTYYVVVEGSGSAEGTFALHMTFTTCNGVVPGPGALHELEPNDEPWMAQPWNPEQQLFGEQTPLGDADWFLLESAGADGEILVTIQPDTFDAVVTAYVLTEVGIVPLGTSNEGGFCEAEQLSIFLDPCGPFLVVGGPYVSVSQSPAGAMGHGHYLGSVVVGGSPVPLGDCCQYPIQVGGLPYTDTRNSSVGYRDKGFGPSPDVWYKLVLDQGGVLTAQTCGGQSNFDTVLRVVDDDCETVLASNDNSLVCGAGSTQSWLSTCLTASTYYVVVEGSGNASGTFTLNLALRPSGAAASLAVGQWGELWEEPTRHFGDATSTLWLRADDPCGDVVAVDFLGHAPAGPTVLLGSDLDGWELPLATTHEGGPAGDGWFLEFDPSLLRTDPGPLCFTALAHHADGTLQVVEAESWYAPDLEPERLFAPLDHWETIHTDHFTVHPADGLPSGLEISWQVQAKQLEWSRAVPPVSQRGVSDTHCAPAAAAACLEWLDATYGSHVTGGLSGDSLTTALGGYMGTNSNPAAPGTKPSAMASGLERWINDHGGGYTVHSQYPATTAEMQNQGEAKGQDVITVLYWAGGGGHAVTLSSVHNLPNADGTVAMDFMDPWTGNTQWGNFNPATGAFSGYGDGNDSGQLGRSVYVCPSGGGGGGGGARTEWQPFQGPLPVPVPEGLSWLLLQVRNTAGKVMEAFVVVERRPALAPLVQITLDEATDCIHLAWEAVPDAVGYAVYRWPAGFAPPEGDAPWLVTGHTWADDEVPPAGQWFYAVRTMYEQ